LINTVTTTLGGGLGRRASIASSATFSRGTVGMGAREANSYENWTGSVGLHFALSRRASLDARYSSYGHRFDSAVQLAPGLASGLNRQGLRVSLTWLAPLLQ
jgi:hypothetical protein